MTTHKCHQCGKTFQKKPSDRKSIKGRPWKHTFCQGACYNRWRAVRHLEIKRKWLKFQRKVWGTTELHRWDVGKARKVGRIYEIKARDIYLPAEGFTDIVDMSGKSNQFYIDFVATFRKKRVLVDATIKLRAGFVEKKLLAEALGMKLYILHVSPMTDGLYYLHEVRKGQNSSRVPAKFIRALSAKL